MTSRLAKLIAQESELVREFVVSLTAEQEALKKGEVDTLAAVNVRKAELVERLNAAEAERNGVLAEAGFSADQKGMQDWLAKHCNEPAVAKEWTRLRELAAEARQLHDINGQIIAVRLQATTQALSILNQQAQRSSLYGRNGLTSQQTGSRIIDAA